MEGLRGIAVFLVFWVHYSTLIEPWLSGPSLILLQFVHGFGHLGVDLFFVLSGYLIYGTIINKKDFVVLKYVGRRVQRIYPTFIAVFMIYIFLSYMFPTESKIPVDAYKAILYLAQNFFLLPGIFDIKPIIAVAWSLSYEAFYYILIPLVIFFFRLKNWSVNNRIALWVAVAVLGFLLHLVWGGPGRLLMFVSGILLFEVHANKKIMVKNGGFLSLVISLLLFGAAKFYEINDTFLLATVFILFLYFNLCAFNPTSNLFDWLIFTPLRWLGNMSYSYYLIHGLTLKFSFLMLSYVIPGGFSSGSIYYLLWAPLFLFTLVTSFALFVLVERPFSLHGLKKKNSNKRMCWTT